MKDLAGIEYNINDFISYACGKKIVVFGAGRYGNYLYKVLADNGIDAYGVCDNNKEKLDLLKEKYPVITLEDLKNDLGDYYFIIAIAKLEILKTIRKQLSEYGVKPNKMVIPLAEIKSGWFDSRIIFDSEYCVPAVKEQWQHARQCGTRIADYFESNAFYRLIVIENDQLKGWLDRDLADSSVTIIKRINSLEEFAQKEECDAVVIIDEANYEIIEEELMQKTDIPIISIWDVVRF